jgi:hypothetical protein
MMRFPEAEGSNCALHFSDLFGDPLKMIFDDLQGGFRVEANSRKLGQKRSVMNPVLVVLLVHQSQLCGLCCEN